MAAGGRRGCRGKARLQGEGAAAGGRRGCRGKARRAAEGESRKPHLLHLALHDAAAGDAGQRVHVRKAKELGVGNVHERLRGGNGEGGFGRGAGSVERGPKEQRVEGS
eukprot:363609-Chlamydomonas_euryale.AAC.2